MAADKICICTLNETLDWTALKHISELVLDAALEQSVMQMMTKFRVLKCSWVPVKYLRDRTSNGRVYASHSLQSMKGWVARIVGHKFYRDVDMVNAGPVCFRHACLATIGRSCTSLDDYVSDREGLIDAMVQSHPELQAVPFKDMKKVVLRSMHGGSYGRAMAELGVPLVDTIAWLDKFEDDIGHLVQELKGHAFWADEWAATSDIRNTRQRDRSFVSRVWQSVEAKALLELVEYLAQSHHMAVGVLKHDGLWVVQGEPMSRELLDEMEDHVKRAVGVEIQLVEKSLEPTADDWDKYWGPKEMMKQPNWMERVTYGIATRAYAQGLKRLGDHVVKPHSTLPRVYVEHSILLDYANETIVGMGVPFHSVDTLKQWLCHVDHPRFPLLGKNSFDDTKVAFENGYVCIKTLTFTEWAGTETFLTKCFYEIPFRSDMLAHDPQNTPLWNNIIHTQLAIKSPEGYVDLSAVHTLYALLGRLFFPTKSYDNWQVSPYLIGDANTGKSSVVSIIKAMFPLIDVGIISSSLEEKFGMRPLAQKRINLSPDLPKDIHRKWDSSDFQIMISGDSLSCPKKGGDPLMIDWVATTLLAGNHWPKWEDSQGQISRRLIPFLFKILISNRDVSLMKKITERELPYIQFMLVYYYHALRERLGDGDFLSSLPQSIKDNIDEMSVAENHLARFLQNGSKVYQVTKQMGQQTPLSELETAFTNYMEFECKKRRAFIGNDHHALRQAGYELKKLNLCKICGLSANKSNCGVHFDRSNRRIVKMVINMKLIRRDRDDPPVSFSSPSSSSSASANRGKRIANGARSSPKRAWCPQPVFVDPPSFYTDGSGQNRFGGNV
jgi:hypothetical protein